MRGSVVKLYDEHDKLQELGGIARRRLALLYDSVTFRVASAFRVT